VPVTDKVYVKNHRQLASQLDTSFPRSAFAGATLEALFGAEGLAELDSTTRERVLDFAEAFMDCDCQSAPHCGHPERKFVRYLLELRAGGLGPEAMVDAMTDDYMLYAYPGDVRSFLDDAVRTLDAVEALAEVDGDDGMADRARRRRSGLL
jgi:superfamily II helicase